MSFVNAPWTSNLITSNRLLGLEEVEPQSDGAALLQHRRRIVRNRSDGRKPAC